MGSLFSHLLSFMWPSRQYKIVIVARTTLASLSRWHALTSALVPGAGQRGKNDDFVQTALGRGGVHNTNGRGEHRGGDVSQRQVRGACARRRRGGGQRRGGAPHAAPTPQCWDLGGQQALRASWASYYKHTDAVVLVVDSTDGARMGLVQGELARLLAAEELAGAAICVFANKQDLRDALRTAELTDALGLHAVRSHEWTVQPCCALTGEGLDEGLGWITSRVTGTSLSVKRPQS